jgi:hypothetical protein
MGPKGSIKPVRANVEYWEVVAQFSIDGSGGATLVYGDGMSVAHDATGEYTITFTEYGPGPLLDLEVKLWTAADAETPIASPVTGSYADGAVQFEVWDVDETAAKVDPADGDTMVVTAKFLKTV